jgi:DNA-binding NtrC family response regulator
MLSDIVMPGEMDGAALATKVRARYPKLKVLLMTGHAQQIQALSSLGFEILPKPCSARILADAIRRIAGKPSGATAP